jgi:hypothetical protein
MTRYIAAAFGATLTVLVSLAAGLGLLTGGTQSSGCNALSPNASAAATAISQARPTGPTDWDQEQLGNAVTIIAVGSRLGVLPRGQVIALATAIQESSLRNLLGGDRDSLGLFHRSVWSRYSRQMGRCEAQPMRSASETMIPSGPRT